MENQGNENLIKQKIHEKIKDVDVKSNQSFKYWYFGSIAVFMIIMVVMASVFISQTIQDKELNLRKFIPIPVLMFIFFIFITVLGIYYAKTSRKTTQNTSNKLAAMNLHQLYFENTNSFFPSLEFKFEGIGRSEVFNTHCLKFKIGSESIVWNIDEDIETRTRGSGDDEETYEVYILKFVLNSTTQKLPGIEEIKISAARKINFGNKSALFKSESIEFNKKYRVESFNEMDVYKVFTPKMIEKFNISDLDLSEGEVIYLENNLVQVKFRSRREPEFSQIPDPLDFSAIRWSKNRSKTVDSIYNKIKLDFDRYLDIQELLEPLELYSN